MKNVISAISVTLMLLMGLVIPATTAEESAYTPQPGDEVVIYLMKFKPEDFEKGKKIQVKEFSKAMQESGQTRHTYFLEDAENKNTLAVSFFKKGHETQQWHNDDKRQEVLDKLKPLWREPQTFEKFRLVDSHTTD